MEKAIAIEAAVTDDTAVPGRVEGHKQPGTKDQGVGIGNGTPGESSVPEGPQASERAGRAYSLATFLYKRVQAYRLGIGESSRYDQQAATALVPGIGAPESADTGLHTPELYRSLGLAVSTLRWMTIVTLFFLAILQPRAGRFGVLNWQLLVMFAGYNLLAEVALSKLLVRPSRSTHMGKLAFRALHVPMLWRVIVDLPAAGLVYYASATPGAPQFDLIFLAVLCAAVSMPLRISLIYTAAAVAITAVIEPTLALWAGSAEAVRELGARMVLLALVGTGTAIMARRLVIEQEEAWTAKMQTRKLQEFDRLRDDFIASITHDLRTPFTAVRAGLGMVEMSMFERLRPEELQLLANVRRNSERLGILINDLLTFNQFESAALHIDQRPLDVGFVVTSATAGLQTLLAEKTQTLDLDIPEPLPHKGDARRLEQVIVNLVDNAHRHTPPGTHISISGKATAEEVTVIIRDNGPGIPPEECEAIFQRFHRVDLAEGGWGLGLTIAQAIIEKHNGRIWVDSKLGEGAAFHIALPRYHEA